MGFINQLIKHQHEPTNKVWDGSKTVREIMKNIGWQLSEAIFAVLVSFIVSILDGASIDVDQA